MDSVCQPEGAICALHRKIATAWKIAIGRNDGIATRKGMIQAAIHSRQRTSAVLDVLQNDLAMVTVIRTPRGVSIVSALVPILPISLISFVIRSASLRYLYNIHVCAVCMQGRGAIRHKHVQTA